MKLNYSAKKMGGTPDFFEAGKPVEKSYILSLITQNWHDILKIKSIGGTLIDLSKQGTQQKKYMKYFGFDNTNDDKREYDNVIEWLKSNYLVEEEPEPLSFEEFIQTIDAMKVEKEEVQNETNGVRHH